MSTTEVVDIRGLDKGAVLKALHDGTRPLGMGLLHAASELSLKKAQADYADLIKDGGRIDYYLGRSIKVDLDGDSIDPIFYDRDAGPGAAASAIARLREVSRQSSDEGSG